MRSIFFVLSFYFHGVPLFVALSCVIFFSRKSFSLKACTNVINFNFLNARVNLNRVRYLLEKVRECDWKDESKGSVFLI